MLSCGLNTLEEKEIIERIEESSIEDDGVNVLGENGGEEGNIFEESAFEVQDDDINQEEESTDGGNGKDASPNPEILTFDPPEPKAEPKKRKSQLEQLGISKSEKRDLTEDEQREVEELAKEFRSALNPKKSDDFWKGVDSEGAF